jgi:hypothetical protein
MQGELQLTAARCHFFESERTAMTKAKTPIPVDEDKPVKQPERQQAACLRCGAVGPVGDDGFCDRCEKALEQACL